MGYVIFGDWYFSINMLLWQSIHIAAWIKKSFHFIAEEYVHSTERLPALIQGTGVKVQSKRSDVTPRRPCVIQGNCIKIWLKQVTA